MNQVCANNLCVACGMAGAACCPNNMCAMGSSCVNGQCLACGKVGNPCCANAMCSDMGSCCGANNTCVAANADCTARRHHLQGGRVRGLRRRGTAVLRGHGERVQVTRLLRGRELCQRALGLRHGAGVRARRLHRLRRAHAAVLRAALLHRRGLLHGHRRVRGREWGCAAATWACAPTTPAATAAGSGSRAAAATCAPPRAACASTMSAVTAASAPSPAATARCAPAAAAARWAPTATPAVAKGVNCANGMACSDGSCGNCGGKVGAPCCNLNGNTSCTGPNMTCQGPNSTCLACGGLGQVCCSPNNYCSSGAHLRQQRLHVALADTGASTLSLSDGSRRGRSTMRRARPNPCRIAQGG